MAEPASDNKRRAKKKYENPQFGNMMLFIKRKMNSMAGGSAFYFANLA